MALYRYDRTELSLEKKIDKNITSVKKDFRLINLRFTVASLTFDMGKLEKIRRHHCKEGLKISENAEFKSDLWKSNKDLGSQSREILLIFAWGWAQTCPPTYKGL